MLFLFLLRKNNNNQEDKGHKKHRLLFVSLKKPRRFLCVKIEDFCVLKSKILKKYARIFSWLSIEGIPQKFSYPLKETSFKIVQGTIWFYVVKFRMQTSLFSKVCYQKKKITTTQNKAAGVP